MQASKTATEGSNAIPPPEILGVLRQRLYSRPLGVELRLQRQQVDPISNTKRFASLRSHPQIWTCQVGAHCVVTH